jgi:putative DNA primase/helicase
VIGQWWSRWPDANVGVATGSRSNIVVLDVDPRSGGLEALEDLKTRIGDLPATLSVRTGSGGSHFYFRPRDGEVLSNSASKLGPGLDFKAENGFVVAPPSLHVSGNRYSWIS